MTLSGSEAGPDSGGVPLAPSDRPAVVVVPRILGIDSLRIILAAVVVFGHYHLHTVLPKAGHLNMAIRLVAGNIACGPAAVIVFFVISGMCIHYPYRAKTSLPLIPYFARRHVRIWVPIGSLALAGLLLHKNVLLWQSSVLWSLYAEEIYYLLYPLLRQVAATAGWVKLTLASFVPAIVVVATQPRAVDFSAYGVVLTAVIGLPLWLLGCVLAEQFAAGQLKVSRVPISVWRFTAWGASALCLFFRFHGHVGYPWTLPLFGIFAYYWLKQEVLYFQAHPPLKWLENWGKASYSLYLTHPLIPHFFNAVGAAALLEGPLRFLMALIAAAFCVLFYQCVEKPSHKAARKLAKFFESKSVPVVEVAA